MSTNPSSWASEPDPAESPDSDEQAAASGHTPEPSGNSSDEAPAPPEQTSRREPELLNDWTHIQIEQVEGTSAHEENLPATVPDTSVENSTPPPVPPDPITGSIEGMHFPPGRAYIRINELLGGGGATFKIFKGTELTIGGHGIGLALLLIAFGPVAVIVVGTYAGLPVLLIVLLAVLVLIGVVGVTVMIVKLLGNSSRDQP